MNTRFEHTPMTEQVFEKLFKTHYDALCHFAMGYLKDRDSSEGVVQEVFVALWHKRESIDPGKSVKSYLYTAVKNRCINYIRDHKKFRSYVLDVEIELEVPVEEEKPFEAEELKKRIEEALGKLPPRCREVFELSRFEEKKYNEIAAALNISVKTVEVQMSKALKILREELGDLIFILLMMWIL